MLSAENHLTLALCTYDLIATYQSRSNHKYKKAEAFVFFLKFLTYKILLMKVAAHITHLLLQDFQELLSNLVYDHQAASLPV